MVVKTIAHIKIKKGCAKAALQCLITTNGIYLMTLNAKVWRKTMA
jgi:hypothetical protein